MAFSELRHISVLLYFIEFLNTVAISYKICISTESGCCEDSKFFTCLTKSAII